MNKKLFLFRMFNILEIKYEQRLIFLVANMSKRNILKIQTERVKFMYVKYRRTKMSSIKITKIAKNYI